MTEMTLMECVTQIIWSLYIWVYGQLHVFIWFACFLPTWSLWIEQKQENTVIPPSFPTPNVDWLKQLCRTLSGNITTSVSVSDVLIQVAVRAASVTVLCGIGYPFPSLLRFLIPCAVRAAQVPVFGLNIIYSIPRGTLAPMITPLLVVIVP